MDSVLWTEKCMRGKHCFLYRPGNADALLIQPIAAHDPGAPEQTVENIKMRTTVPFTFVAFQIDDWNRELPPWEAPAVFGRETFGAGAAETLAWITDVLLPELERTEKIEKCLLGGYSLAGLFALWAAYQTDRFRGIAAVSPSVWFPGWERYTASNRIRSPEVYLSLGDREEKTRNRTMATVGENIRLQYERLRHTDFIKRCVLEWNSGDHFRSPDYRTAKGFAWLLNGFSDHERNQL